MKDKRELYDFDGHIVAGNFQAWFESGQSILISAADFFGWLYLTGKIGNYSSDGNGFVELFHEAGYFDPRRQVWIETAKGSTIYTFQEFLNDCVDEAHVIEYLKSMGTPPPATEWEAYVAEVTGQASPEVEPQQMTEEQMWEYYYDDSEEQAAMAAAYHHHKNRK